MPTNYAEDDSQELPDDAPDTADAADAAVDDPAAEADEAEAVDTDPGPLQRSQDALDEGREAASEALKDRRSDDEDHAFGQ